MKKATQGSAKNPKRDVKPTSKNRSARAINKALRGDRSLERARNPKRHWASLTLWAHKRRGFTVRHTIDNLEARAKATPNCEYCGVKLDYGFGHGRKPNGATLDRNKGGQTSVRPSNTKIVCRTCNSKKQKFNPEKFKVMLATKRQCRKCCSTRTSGHRDGRENWYWSEGAKGWICGACDQRLRRQAAREAQITAEAVALMKEYLTLKYGVSC
jgi:hypothetical protein